MGAITSLEEMQRPENRAQFPWLLPWRSLSDNTSCHLQDLLEPMPQEAIPPGLLLPHEWQDLDFKELPAATTPSQMGRPLPTVDCRAFSLAGQALCARSITERHAQRADRAAESEALSPSA